MTMHPKDSDHGIYELNQLVDQVLHIRTHFELLIWLQGAFQKYLPHDIMIAAWGDFSIGVVFVDIVSALPGVRTGQISSKNLVSLLTNLYNNWTENAKKPFILNVDKGVFADHQFDEAAADFNLKKMRSGVMHGIKDYRGGHDCLYVFLSSAEKADAIGKKTLFRLLPHIDSTLRQLEHLPEQLPTLETSKPEAEEEIQGTLTSREIEIMEWVKSGKTNQDIGLILNISAFTVKNHLQRIFKKLDVMNRAQAVTKFNRMYQTND